MREIGLVLEAWRENSLEKGDDSAHRSAGNRSFPRPKKISVVYCNQMQPRKHVQSADKQVQLILGDSIGSK
ncbi:hypothetical protein Y032_0045g1281 [Ancylostoma ceylanicum]|uniref:Uncharacterized protein n=1 Tax=Ancylostoma ceylanicum TaxID=53326 RepID=A0A016UE52_9BILA|nr:hypothetical protein Y032_0045g1281 [Ancylostoma ceylanicum]